jgi:DNA-binding transcriptional regulator/RsmH inhibitor MraZ
VLHLIDILREMMMETIEKQILDFQTQKEVFAYNQKQLEKILNKLKKNKELNNVEKAYLEIIFD